MQISNQLINSLLANNQAANNRQGQSADKQVNRPGFEDVLMYRLNTDKSGETARPSGNYNKSAVEEEEKTAPYSYLADDNGIINYDGVIFQCDYERNTISLGDMSNPDDIMTISLAGGGLLKVNRNNLDDLAKAIGMFSAQDTKRILDAIATEKKVKSKENEIDKVINKTFENISNE